MKFIKCFQQFKFLMPEDWELERLKHKKLRELMRGTKPEEKLGEPVPLNEEDFDEFVKKHRIVLVDFWASWCGPCMMIAPIIEELAREYSGKVVFAKVDVDRNRRLAMKFGIMSIPTLILFKDGRPVDMIIGAQPKPAIEEVISRHL